MLEDDNHILDDLDIQPKAAKTYWELIRWWEKKRLLYNIIVGGFGCFAYLIMTLNIPDASSSEGLGLFFLFGGMYALGCNVSYCAGWGIDIAAKFGFDYYIPEQYKKILYWLGTVFSMIPILGLLGLAALI